MVNELSRKSTLSSLLTLSTDHSIEWTARSASTALLSRVVCGGGEGAEAALEDGGFLALLELMDRDTYPYYRQGGVGPSLGMCL